MVAFDDLSLDAHVDALDGVRTLAWRVLALGAFMLAATLAVVQRYRPADGNPFTLTPPVSAGVAAVCVGAALAAGVVVHGALSPRPGLARFTREHAGATRRAGRRESSGDSTVHVADTVEAYCAHLHRQTRRLGFAAAGATVAILVGCVYVAYGLGAQVSPAVEPCRSSRSPASHCSSSRRRCWRSGATPAACCLMSPGWAAVGRAPDSPSRVVWTPSGAASPR